NWATDGHRLVVRGSESSHPIRLWVQEIVGNSPHPVTPEGVDGRFVRVNHTDYVSARDRTGILRLYPINGGEARTVAGSSDQDAVIGGSSNTDVLYITESFGTPRQILKLDVVTGIRQ